MDTTLSDASDYDQTVHAVRLLRVIADCKLSNITAGSDVQCGFGNIDAHTKWIWLTHFYPSLQIRYGIRTTVRVSDEWLSVCASR